MRKIINIIVIYYESALYLKKLLIKEVRGLTSHSHKECYSS